MRNFIGQNDFTWFIGVIEDRNDPVQLGRVRVRCFGWHTEDKGQIPTDTLPWAIPLQGITSPALNGMGQSPTGLVEGSWVVGFFLDGENAQEPVIMGSFASSPSEFGEPTKGFSDPNIRPDTDVPIDPHNGGHPHSIYPRFIKESDVNRLARNSNTVFNTTKDSGATLNVPKANSSDTWSERKTTDLTKSGVKRYNTTYPKNHVYESESGHTVEFDDTKDAERINEHHKSGTFYEVDADGTKVTRIVANNYVIVAGSNNINIKGDVNLTIDSNCRTYIKGNWDIQVDGSKTEVVKKNVTETYGADQTTKITGNLDVDAARIDLN
jgi:hypothetical protein